MLDDFFDKFGGGSTKTEDKDAANGKNEETFDTKKWLGDSGASSHVCKDDKYMTAVKPTQEKVTIGDCNGGRARHGLLDHIGRSRSPVRRLTIYS